MHINILYTYLTVYISNCINIFNYLQYAELLKMNEYNYNIITVHLLQ